jgi:hypothetical protein
VPEAAEKLHLDALFEALDISFIAANCNIIALQLLLYRFAKETNVCFF